MSVDFFQPRRRRRQNGALFAFQPEEVTSARRAPAASSVRGQRPIVRDFVVLGPRRNRPSQKESVLELDHSLFSKIKRFIFVRRHRLISYSVFLILVSVFIGLAYTSLRFIVTKPYRLPPVPASMMINDKPQILGETIVLRDGESLASGLANVVSDPNGIANAVAIFAELLNLRHLAAGQVFDVGYVVENERKRLKSVVLSRGHVDRIIVFADDTGKFYGQHSKNFLQTEETEVSGRIETSLYSDGLAAGAPANKLAELFDVFASSVDFQREIHPGDQFQLIYETNKDSLGNVASIGSLKAARLTAVGKEYLAFYYRNKEGKVGFYSENGLGVSKALLLMPVHGGRLTSGYGSRRNPLYGYNEVHPALDFGAPIGTPIMAAGKGRIIHRGWDPDGYGNYLKIEHKNGYVTLYAHMSGFAKGMFKGAQVLQGQTIGYVGSTGMSTGPHLHYEVHIGKKKTNPAVTVRAMASSNNLKPEEIEDYKAKIQPYLLKFKGQNTSDIDKVS